MQVTSYREFFKKAVGSDPYPYQERLALEDTLPEALSIPTGCGKTAAVLTAWLWRRRFTPESRVRDGTPRRLVYCLPMRVLVEQTREVASKILENLGIQNSAGVHVLMGGESDDDWADEPERDAVIIGTQDMLLSRALNRGYGASRFRWPRLFGLLHTDALWVCDEIQLMGVGRATAAQLEGLRGKSPHLGPSGTIFVSATLDPEWLRTVDHALDPTRILSLSDADRESPALRTRLRSPKTLRPADLPDKPTPKQIAAAILDGHVKGTRTLAVMNRVDSAVAVYEALAKAKVPRCLIHSRFRPPDRDARLAELLAEPPGEGLIAVTTQVIEAGVDVDARTLFFEIAPWSSVVQRLGRCNRAGLEPEANAWWIDVPDAKAEPYRKDDLQFTRDRLRAIANASLSQNPPHSVSQKTPPAHPAATPSAAAVEGLPSTAMKGPSSAAVEGLPASSPEALACLSLEYLEPPTHLLRRTDLYDLFDTSPDISGLDIDVGRFIREADDRDVQVYWRDLERPSDDETPPSRPELCALPVYTLREWLSAGGRTAWVFDPLDDRWVRVAAHELRAGMRVLLPAKAGGYDPLVGFSASARSPVPEVSVAGPEEEPAEDAVDEDPASVRARWVSLAEHTDAVVAAIVPLARLAPEFGPVLERAARWHDAGKSHPEFQQFLRKAGGEPPDPGTLWAKSPGTGGRHSRRHFRHELASALALLANLPGRDGADGQSLAAYLAASHHGKVRLAIRSLPGEKAPEGGGRFACGIWEGDRLPPADLGGGVQTVGTTIDLELMEFGRGREGPSWSQGVLTLLNDLGPFRLAFLEALLRAADARGSRAAGSNGTSKIEVKKVPPKGDANHA